MTARICEACGSAPADTGGWYCIPCEADWAMLMDNQPGQDCSECQQAPATLFGICDDCYDEAYNARAGLPPNTYSEHRWWDEPEPTPPPAPPFIEEVQHLPRRTKKVTANA